MHMKHLKITAALLAVALLLGLFPTALAAVGSTDTYCSRSLTGQHDWGDWTTTKQATCTQAGSRTRVCDQCGYTQTESIPKKGHSWGKWQTTKEATCEKHGEQTRKCSVCGRTETRETDRKAHSWGEWTVITEPTDFSMGTRSHVCKVCGKEKTEDFYPDPTYKKGDKGDGVKDLQEKLNTAGYDCGKVDGDFGKKTQAAVKAIEEAHGVEPDGIAWPGVQKWLTPPEQEPESDPEEDETEDEYGWEPPEEITVFSGGPSSPPLPEEAAGETYHTNANYSTAKYSYTASSGDADGSGLKLGDKALVEVTITNTGTEPLWIGLAPWLSDTRFISCDPGAKGVWDYGEDTYYLHLPGESSQWTLEIDREITEEDLANGYIMDYSEWQAYPQEYYNGEVTHTIPDGWPFSSSPSLEHPVFVSLGDPCLQCKVVPGKSAVNLDQNDSLWCQAQLSNTGGRLLHNAEADVFLWNKDTGAYTYSETFDLSHFVFFPVDSIPHGSDLHDHTSGDYSYPLSMWDLENSIDGATRFAIKGRAWTLDGEMVETELVPREIYPFTVDLWVELAETPAEKAPENGFVKAKVRVGNDGSDTFDASPVYIEYHQPLTDTYQLDDAVEIHGDDLAWLNEGTSQEIEVWIKPRPEDIQAGEVRRGLLIYFYRLIREGGRSVYVDTPKEEVIGHFHGWVDEMRELDFVIPLLTPETESAPEPAPTQEPVRDACMFTLDGHGDGVAEYTLIYCTSHEQLRESTRRALASAGDDRKEALEAAMEQWREALDSEYDALLSQLGETGRAAVEAERAAFIELLEARQALLLRADPGREEEVGQRVLEMLMRKVSEICYERHTAPEARADTMANADLAALEPGQEVWPCEVFTAPIPNGERTHETLCADHREIERCTGELTAAHETNEEAWHQVKLLWLVELDKFTNERYIISDEAERALIAADRVAFGHWLAAHEALLNALWPDQPAVVQQILAQAIRARVLEGCGG